MSARSRVTPVSADSLSLEELRAIAQRELNRRAKIANAHRGLKHSSETRKRIGDGVAAYWATRPVEDIDDEAVTS